MKKAAKKGQKWADRKVYPKNDNDGTDPFINNPFRDLESGNFPAVRKRSKACGTAEPVSDSDAELFLNMFLNLRPDRTLSGISGFLLKDQCQLPMPERKKMKKQKADTTCPSTTPQAAPEDEYAAFLLAMRKATPLTGKGRAISPKPPIKEHISPDPAFAKLLAAQLEFTLLYSDEYLEGRVANMDELIMNRLRSGQMSPEAHLDLHGLNAEQAFESLRVFIRDAWFKSLRVVLLVPGRGKNSPAGHGVLRRKVQEWLTHEPFKRVVLAFCTAQPHDGGPGSIYVLLRKFRKKGHISWNRLPADADLLDF